LGIQDIQLFQDFQLGALFFRREKFWRGWPVCLVCPEWPVWLRPGAPGLCHDHFWITDNAFAPCFIKNPRVSLEGAKAFVQKHREIAQGAKILPRGQEITGGLGSGI
jgi:hypothetical protein